MRQGRAHPYPNGLAGRVEPSGSEQGAAKIQGHRQVAPDAAAAGAGGTRAGQGLLEVAPRALPRDLDQAELGDLEDPGAGAVSGELLLEPLEDLLPVRRILHVDEVHDEE